MRSGDDPIPYTDQVITQLLPLDSISANDAQIETSKLSIVYAFSVETSVRLLACRSA